ncbi:NADH dehydrogenase [ubiquinone] 1 beta subcomplex subunit 9 [Bombus pascuorum]|uniref:NADH dehydrogenase [ubiquinone] 1 beta subcomplex subunit 9 n=1 Tax=Bombus pascuorum TaxID=65598 RepID=UPI00213BF77D|nr:NADH dehydrogenase [ubiquinone] 1 beta subcomplex subunit 9 [Bombus pascuorum]
MAQLPSPFISHTRKVCSLYKRAIRALEDQNIERHEFRYNAVLLRQRFEKNRHIPDARIAKQLLLEGEEELFNNTHPDPSKFPNSPGGICHGRFVIPPDSVMDYWDPIEKARYPKYFAEREKLKVEYEKLYNKLYNETPAEVEKAKTNK